MSVQLYEQYDRMAGQAGRYGHNTLQEKWSKELAIISEAFNGKCDAQKLFGTAILLENTERFLRNKSSQNNMFSLNEATQPADTSFFKQFAFNNLIAVYPNLILPDLVSVQPQLSWNGEIRYMRATYGSNKGSIRQGDTMFSQFNMGDHPAVSDYSSDTIEAEPVDPVTSFNLGWGPVIPGSVAFFDETGVQLYADNGQGGIVDGNGAASGTINYDTKAVTLTTAMPAGSSVNYTYDNLTVPVDVPEVNIKIVTSPIQARSRKLKALFSMDSGLTMASDYGITLSSEILSMSSAQLKREIDDEGIKDLATMGTAPAAKPFDMSIPDGVSLVDHYAGFPATITEASNNIWNLTQVANASWVMLGADAANIVESIPRFKSIGAVNPKGAHLAGYLGNLPVYKSAAIQGDEYVCGYKGDSLFESGYIYAPLFPIMSTQLLTDETFTSRQGFSTAYGKKMTNSDFYSTSKIIKSQG